MRFVGTLVFMLLVACGGSSDNSDAMASFDLSGVANDLSHIGCAQLVVCIGSCNGASSCIGTCMGEASTAASSLYGELYECAVDGCISSDMEPVDGGPGSCASSTDESVMCQACITTYGADPNGACAAKYTQCLSGQ